MLRQMELGGALRLLVGFVCLSLLGSGTSFAESCGRDVFSDVFNKASSELVRMNSKRASGVKLKLKELKALASWSDQEFLVNASPLVKNEQILEFDSQSKALLASAADFGGSGTTLSRGECGKVDELRALLSLLIENTREKWSFMEKGISVAIANMKSTKNP